MLASTMSTNAVAEEIEDILRGRNGYVFAFEQHLALVKTLGMPEFGVCAGYGYLDAGEMPSDLRKENLTFIE